MAVHFRKSISIAPGVRLNLNKKSTSVSFGGKGFRQTISTTGRHRTTVSLPGTGVYWTETTGGSATDKQSYKGTPRIPAPKSKRVTLFLAIVGGMFGAHRFYVGKSVTGWLYLFTCGGFFFGAVADIFAICKNKFTDKYGRRVGTADVCILA